MDGPAGRDARRLVAPWTARRLHRHQPGTNERWSGPLPRRVPQLTIAGPPSRLAGESRVREHLFGDESRASVRDLQACARASCGDPVNGLTGKRASERVIVSSKTSSHKEKVSRIEE